jgi:hypothetical protein
LNARPNGHQPNIVLVAGNDSSTPALHPAAKWLISYPDQKNVSVS